MSKTLKWIIGILVVLVLALIGLKKAGVFGKDEGRQITAENAVNRVIIESVNASGKIYPEIEVKVSSDISGEIVELSVEEGDTVRRGQVLAKVYADIYASQRDQAAAAVAQAQAQTANADAQLGSLTATLEQTESTYKRQKSLLDQNVISQAEFEQAQQAYLSARANYNAALQSIKANEANVRSAMANLTSANKNVNRATIIAPMDGIVSLLAVKKGERVVGTAQMAGTEIMRIADLSSMETVVDVGENDIPKVKIGDTAVIEVDAYNNRKFKGIVYKIANPAAAVTSTSVTNYEVHIRVIPDSYKDLLGRGKAFPFRPNMTASADIQTSTHANVLSVPLNAVTTRDKSDGHVTDHSKKDNNSKQDDSQKNHTAADDDLQEVVFVVQKDGTVKKMAVKTDIQDINYIQILQGLKEGDQVVTGPYDVVSKELNEGDKVKIVTKEELVQVFKK